MRPSVRARITLAFVGAMAVVVLALGAFVYIRSGSDLLTSMDAGLRSRADVLSAQVRSRGPNVPSVEPALIEADEAFAQIADRDGTLLRSSRIVASAPLIDRATIASLDHARFFDQTTPGIDDVTRVLAVPVHHADQTFVLMVGASLQDRRDQMLQLAATLVAGGAAALALISFGGWMLVGAVLRPVDRMRQEASAISVLESSRRLAVPPGDDEFAALATTLNAMLDRVRDAFERERRFVDNASHELRTPVGVLRSRLELALSRSRTRTELEETLRRSLADAEHLSRLADDLLVLSRARDGRVPIHREDVNIAELVQAAVAGHRPAADARNIALEIVAPNEWTRVDPLRVRQVLDNLLDNAIRHAPSGGAVRVSAGRADGTATIDVEDTGDGFPAELLAVVFLPFVRGRPDDGAGGAGLGLAIVKAVAEAHGGSAHAENLPDAGARVTVSLRVE
jgi:two-component system, OmpR family, sensor kinase